MANRVHIIYSTLAIDTRKKETWKTNSHTIHVLSCHLYSSTDITATSLPLAMCLMLIAPLHVLWCMWCFLSCRLSVFEALLPFCSLDHSHTCVRLCVHVKLLTVNVWLVVHVLIRAHSNIAVYRHWYIEMFYFTGLSLLSCLEVHHVENKSHKFDLFSTSSFTHA